MIKYKFIVGAVFGLFLISACAAVDKQAINTRIEQAEHTLPNHWQSAMLAASHPRSWQSLFGDPLLAEYLARAGSQNLSLEQAAARIRQSAARLRQSEAVLLPTITADLRASGSTLLTNLNTANDSYGAGISASWDPDIFGGNKADIRQSTALLAVQKANGERLRRTIMAQVARAYIFIITADLQLELARENLSFIAETKRISKARFDAGDIARDNLSLSLLEFENASASVQNLEFSARQSRRALSLLIGDFGADKLSVANALPAPALLGSQSLPANLLASRFDILAARANLVARIATLESAAADDWPRIGLSGRIGSSGNLEDLFNPARYIANLAASLVGVIFDNGRNQARRDGANASLDEALASYKQILRNAVSEVNAAFDETAVLRRSLAALNRASIAANKALELEKIKYDLGESILLDVLTVQRRVNSIKSSRISTERRLLDAQISAYLAIGAQNYELPSKANILSR